MTPSDWPPATDILNPEGTGDIVLLCEHASNHIPSEYHSLGVTPDDLQRHIAWDPGAADVTRRLSQSLDAPAFLGTYSRLLIDLNRPLEAPSSIVTRSEATDIPGNENLDEADIRRRIEAIFLPYHSAVGAFLDARQAAKRPTRLVCIHSFTPVYLNEMRTWHGGVLFGEASTFGRDVLAKLQTPGLNIGENVPYATNRTEDYGVPIHGDDRGIPAILIEMRNDLITTPAGVAEWAERLLTALA